jgi:hypothetical protein
MFDIPVVDEQAFDTEAEMQRVEACIGKLRMFDGDGATLAEAIALLNDYADDLQYQKERE